MRNWKRVLHDLPPHLLAWIWSVLLLLQMGLAFFAFSEPRLPGLRVVGWAIWALGTVFAILPIFTLRTRGGVPQGKSYMETTTLVDTGIYAIVRHPQGGTAGILLSLALALIGQHWLLLILAAVGMVLIYIDAFRTDEACIEKFGQGYVRYMQRVPRVNFLAGILRLLVHPRPESTEEVSDDEHRSILDQEDPLATSRGDVEEGGNHFLDCPGALVPSDRLAPGTCVSKDVAAWSS